MTRMPSPTCSSSWTHAAVATCFSSGWTHKASRRPPGAGCRVRLSGGRQPSQGDPHQVRWRIKGEGPLLWPDTPLSGIGPMPGPPRQGTSRFVCPPVPSPPVITHTRLESSSLLLSVARTLPPSTHNNLKVLTAILSIKSSPRAIVKQTLPTAALSPVQVIALPVRAAAIL